MTEKVVINLFVVILFAAVVLALLAVIALGVTLKGAGASHSDVPDFSALLDDLEATNQARADALQTSLDELLGHLRATHDSEFGVLEIQAYAEIGNNLGLSHDTDLSGGLAGEVEVGGELFGNGPTGTGSISLDSASGLSTGTGAGISVSACLRGVTLNILPPGVSAPSGTIDVYTLAPDAPALPGTNATNNQSIAKLMNERTFVSDANVEAGLELLVDRIDPSPSGMIAGLQKFATALPAPQQFKDAINPAIDSIPQGA